ncbi:MAG: hypothetical protein ACNA8W_00320 [Bradymonadaceae bacterium]
MDYFGKEQLKELIEASAQPAISIYVPIERRELTKKATRLLFRSAVEDARSLLADSEHQDRRVWGPMIERLQDLVEDATFWNEQMQGLAVFIAPGYEKIYRLPMSIEKTVVVSSTFHTRPLLELMASPDRYWVLALGQDEVALWEGSASGLAQIPLPEGVPPNLEEALQLEMEKGQDPLIFHSSFRQNQGRELHHRNAGRGLAGPVFDSSGSGGGKDRQNAYLKEFFHKIDQGVTEYLRDQNGPLILAAVDYHHPMYQEVNSLENLVEEGIHGNVQYWNAKELHEKAWPIARKVADRKLEEALRLWERSYGQGGTEGDLSNLGRLIIEGRIHLLFIDKDRRVWGGYDLETGAVRVGTGEQERAGAITDGDPSAEALDILDEFAEQVIIHGGEALLVPSEKMPTRTGVAAILRGNNRHPASS